MGTPSTRHSHLAHITPASFTRFHTPTKTENFKRRRTAVRCDPHFPPPGHQDPHTRRSRRRMCDTHCTHSQSALSSMLSKNLFAQTARVLRGSAPLRAFVHARVNAPLQSTTLCGTPFTAELASRNAHRRARSSLGRSMSRLDHSTLRPCRLWPSHRRRQLPLDLS